VSNRPGLLNVVASELLRLRRRGVVLGWLGLTAALAVLISVVMFQIVKNGNPPPVNGPGINFPSAATLLSDKGIVAGLSAASSMFGVVTLSFWALATSTDYSTGLIRILVSAQPRRWRLLLGKWMALALATALTTGVALVVSLMVAPMAARSAGFTPTAWGTNLGPDLASATVNLFCALLVWGTIGLALATMTRSSGIAIGVGIGYVLLLETVIKVAVSSVGRWLPGTTIAALANGGTPDLTYGRAVALGLVYVVVALGAALVVYTRRDVTD
jgi:ABC-type transport system involved in multi-copper enzyme maturation permease subunit